MRWTRRRDLEGGKELGVWLLVDTDSGEVSEELYVESHEYRGGAFDVYTYTAATDWQHRGEHRDVEDAFADALAYLEDHDDPVAGR
jgi:hypothetical protein